LNKKAWVANPEVLKLKKDERDLSNVPEDEDRQLLLLSDFITKFPDIPLNIEMKKSFKRKINDTDRRGLKDNIGAFTDILNNDPSNRTIVVVSGYDEYIDEFRDISDNKYPTGLSIQEQLYLLFFKMKMKNRALETTYDSTYSGIKTIEKVREAGGSTFVFLTGFGPILPAIDEKIPSEEKIFKILDRGVDGIMTDRPASVRPIIDRWKTTRG
jgi:glycerophosphoryl diester phosphodiesterase